MLNEGRKTKQVSMPIETISSGGTRREPKTLKREVVLVTPDMAKEWLEAKNAINRTVNWAMVREYARRMGANEWHLNGDALKFDAEDNLFEGQHRLHAVVLHGKPVYFEVIRGMPYEDRFEDGGRPRSLGDYMAIAGLCEPRQGTKVAAMVEIIGSLDERSPKAFSPRNSQHKDEAIAIARRYIEAIRWVLATFPSGTPAPLSGAFAWAWQTRPAQTEKFAAHFLSMNRTGANDPATCLSELMSEFNTMARQSRSYRLEISMRIVSAIFAHAKGKKLTVLRKSQHALDWAAGG